MKTELILDEMKIAIKRLEKDNKLKTIICIGAGLAVVIVGIVFLVVKMKDKNQNQLPCDYDDGWDAWDEDDYADYEDYDDDDYSYDDADVDYASHVDELFAPHLCLDEPFGNERPDQSFPGSVWHWTIPDDQHFRSSCVGNGLQLLAIHDFAALYHHG